MLAAFLLLDLAYPMSTEDLITAHCHLLKQCEDNLATIHTNILKSCFASTHQSEQQFEHTIQSTEFKVGDLVLI
jgi:hypothetical protein